MNVVQEILDYAQINNIYLAAENGQLKIDAPKIALTDDFLSSAKRMKAEIIKVISERCNTQLINQAFREGKSVCVWSSVLQEWIWCTPSKEIAERKKLETDKVVYHKGEIIKLVGRDSQSLKDIHEIKKAFDGEITK